MARMRLGPEWSDYWQEFYNNAPWRVRKHFVLEQFISPILSTKEFLRERDRLEATLTEKEWLWLIRHAGIVQGKIERCRRMRLYLPYLTEEEIHQKLRCEKKEFTLHIFLYLDNLIY